MRKITDNIGQQAIAMRESAKVIKSVSEDGWSDYENVTPQKAAVILKMLQGGQTGEEYLITEHDKLDRRQLEIAKSVRVRIADISSQDDVNIIMDIESGLVDWVDGIMAENDSSSARDKFGLTNRQNEMVESFQTFGGHVSRLPEAKIRFIIKHGIFTIMEVPIRGVGGAEVYMPVATVCAISPSSHTMAVDSQGNLLFPNLDPSDLMLPSDLLDLEKKKADICVTDYRSSVRKDLRTEVLKKEKKGSELLGKLGGKLPDEWEGWSPRRFGLAGLGKVVNVIGVGGNKRFFTFNIGTVKRNRDDENIGINIPSIRHNSYAEFLAWRNYFDEIGDVKVYWRNFWTTTKRLLDWGLGMLDQKGYDQGKVLDDSEGVVKQISQKIDLGEHEPL